MVRTLNLVQILSVLLLWICLGALVTFYEWSKKMRKLETKLWVSRIKVDDAYKRIEEIKKQIPRNCNEYRSQIMKLHFEGKTNTEIWKIFNFDRSTISKNIKKWKSEKKWNKMYPNFTY